MTGLSRKVPIAVMASGRGSNFDCIHAAIAAGKLDAEIVAVLSDQPDALVLNKADKLGLKAISVPFGKDRVAHDSLVLAELKKYSPRFLVLAGYMRIMSPVLIEAFRSDRGYSRIVNIHPSLLPSFPGINGYAQAFRYGVKVAGVTIHLIESEVDSGPICAQEAFSIADCASENEVEKRGLAVEHRLYVETLQWVISERFILTQQPSPKGAGRFSVCPN